MEIMLSPNPMLRRKCEPCALGEKAIKNLAKKMARTMYDNNGIGLAAPQVGHAINLIVIDCRAEGDPENPLFLVNPEIVELKGEVVIEEEGCLSCPGITVPIKRQPYVKVRYFDLEANECFLAGDGLLGRCLQHEIDHLQGKTLFERCDPPKRLEAIALYKEALLAGAKPGDTHVD
jgi:peptide deformylase